MDLGVNKFAPRFIGPFDVLKKIGDAYKLELPPTIRLHATFYVGCLKPYRAVSIPSDDDKLANEPVHSATLPDDGSRDVPHADQAGSQTAQLHIDQPRAVAGEHDCHRAPGARSPSGAVPRSPGPRPPATRESTRPPTAPIGRPASRQQPSTQLYRRAGRRHLWTRRVILYGL